MRNTAITLLSVLIAAIFAAPILAGGFEAGTVEFVPSTSFSYQSYSYEDEDLTVTDIQLGGGVGYFFTSVFELQLGLLVNHTSVDPGQGDSFSATSTGMQTEFTFNMPTESNVLPFASIGAGFVSHGGDVGNDDKMTVIAPTASAGLRFLVGNSASVNLGLTYQHHTNALGAEDVSGNIIMIDIGLSAYVHTDTE